MLALLALALHGLLYLSLKTAGDLNIRATAMAKRLLPVVALVTLVSVPATVIARPVHLSAVRSIGLCGWLPRWWWSV
ncbi:hypothetical protein [Edaphobacter modestus]|uniref:hypothetical protein n=1 Tax=Edaphobacter modestus TaxID=388466 RepID=UPI00102C591B